MSCSINEQKIIWWLILFAQEAKKIVLCILSRGGYLVYITIIMCLPFGVYFHEIWYIHGWVSVTDPMRQICKIGCILGNLVKLGVFCRKWYIEGSQNCAFYRYSEQWFFGVWQAHPRTKFGRVEYPPDPQILVKKLFTNILWSTHDVSKFCVALIY